VSVLAIAHRGDPINERENTVAAFSAAIAAGADIIELDVRRAADGEAVVVHDATLERVWGVSAAVAQVSSGQARALGIPDLAQALAGIPDPVQVRVDYEEPDVAEPALDGCGFSGACYDWHRRLRARAKEVRIACTWTQERPCPDTLLDELGAEFWNPSGQVLARFPEEIERMHARGTLVSVWTIDRREHMRHFIDLGVDAVITNRVADLVELLDCVC